MNLQHALGTRIPNGILNFFFKFTFARKVGASSFAEEPQNFSFQILKLSAYFLFTCLKKVHCPGMVCIRFVSSTKS